jgi:hypothetical protein
MNKPRKLLVILVGAAITLDVLAVFLAITPRYFCSVNPLSYLKNDFEFFARFLYRAFPFAVVASQIQLLTLWACFDKRYSPWRLLLLLAFSLCIYRTPDIWAPYHEDYFVTFLIGASSMIATIWFLRLCGLGLINVNSTIAPPDPEGLGRFQYPLRLLLDWMTVLAIVIGSGFYLRNQGFFALEIKYVGIFWGLLAIHACMGLSALWFVLGTKHKAIRQTQFLVYLLIALGCTGIHGNGFYIGLESITVALQMVLYVVALKLIFEAGYRLEWGKTRLVETRTPN